MVDLTITKEASKTYDGTLLVTEEDTISTGIHTEAFKYIYNPSE